MPGQADRFLSQDDGRTVSVDEGRVVVVVYLHFCKISAWSLKISLYARLERYGPDVWTSELVGPLSN